MSTDLLTIDDLTTTELRTVLDRATDLKTTHHAGPTSRELPDRTLAMIFEQPSTRTRVSFETGMTQLGGHAIMLNPRDMQLDRGEPIKDTARSLSRYVDAVMLRMPDHDAQTEFASYASVPTINALSDRAHPCQTLADLLTIRETVGGFDATVAWIGDGNNVARSFVLGAALVGLTIRIATPPGHGLGSDILDRLDALDADYTLIDDPRDAIPDVDIVYTDVWVSMAEEPGDPDTADVFEPYQLNRELLADSSANVMHCLPAHRGEEITDAVIEGDRSIVWDQAENRLHAQNGLLVELLARDGSLAQNSRQRTVR